MQKHTAVALTQTSLIVLILLWFTSVMVDCDAPLSRECDAKIWSSWLDLWRLGWIKNYKELIAGIFAAGAAGLVVVSTRMQIAANSHHNETLREERHKAAIISIGERFDIAGRALRTLVVTDDESKILDALHIPDILWIENAGLAADIRTHALNGKRALQRVNSLNEKGETPPSLAEASDFIRKHAARSAVFAVVLLRHARALKDGHTKFVPAPPTSNLIKTMDECRVGTDDLGDLTRYFDFSSIKATETKKIANARRRSRGASKRKTNGHPA